MTAKSLRPGAAMTSHNYPYIRTIRLFKNNTNIALETNTVCAVNLDFVGVLFFKINSITHTVQPHSQGL